MADDFSELMNLATDLEAAPAALPKHLRKALEVTSVKVKKDAQETVRQRKGLGHAANAIDYDLKGASGDASSMSSEVGYTKGKNAGKLGNLVEFGAPNAKAHMLRRGRNVPVPGGPRRPLSPSHDLGNALLNNEGDFVAGVAQAVDDAQGEAGL